MPVILYTVKRVSDIGCCFPGVVLIAVTFPVDQVFNFRLTSTLNKSLVKHLLYCSFRAVINQLRR